MATNYAKASYTEIIDLQTVRGKASIVGIHTPTGNAPYNKLRGFFTSFRKYRYKGVSRLTMVPAAQLPVDPLGLTGIVGTTDLMDPRDNLNPILFHGAHGESMDAVIDNFFGVHGTGYDSANRLNPTSGYISDSADMLDEDMSVAGWETRYYNRLTDPTWRKFGIQSGVHLRRLVPLTWRLTNTMPILPSFLGPAAGMLAPGNSNHTANPATTTSVNATTENTIAGAVPNTGYVNDSGEWVTARTIPQMFTNGVARLGWLPTTTYGYANGAIPLPSITILPKLFMGILVLPPAYNVEQFFRLAITHVFEFREFTESLGPMSEVAHPSTGESVTSDRPRSPSYFNWIDYTEDGSKKVVASDPLDMGTTLDIINGESEVVSDGVL